MKNGKRCQAGWRPTGDTDKRFDTSSSTYHSPKVWVPHVNFDQGMRNGAFLGPSGDKRNRHSWRSPECWHLISSSNGKLQILTSSGTEGDVPTHNHPRGEEMWLHLLPKVNEKTNIVEGWKALGEVGCLTWPSFMLREESKLSVSPVLMQVVGLVQCF